MRLSCVVSNLRENAGPFGAAPYMQFRSAASLREKGAWGGAGRASSTRVLQLITVVG